MPKANPPRTIRSETNLASRMAVERSERGQSYEVLARLMSEAGCPIQGSALYRIEKGDPPRKVAVDELIALSKVWDLPIEDLLMPPELRDQRRAQALVGELVSAYVDLNVVIERLFDLELALLETDEDSFEYVVRQRQAKLMARPDRPTLQGTWSEKPFLVPLAMDFLDLLDIAVDKQAAWLERMESAVYDENGTPRDPETGEMISILLSLTDDEEAKDG
ncbi:hypothetical protein [Nocardioides sp.]|uniref:hypothetical protein n=1 Tax=Nocardioides sp. TaxID=35761 RepID=UPI0026256728|nr:hypothetical protein [Nocardioides sp.]